MHVFIHEFLKYNKLISKNPKFAKNSRKLRSLKFILKSINLCFSITSPWKPVNYLLIKGKKH